MVPADALPDALDPPPSGVLLDEHPASATAALTAIAPMTAIRPFLPAVNMLFPFLDGGSHRRPRPDWPRSNFCYPPRGDTAWHDQPLEEGKYALQYQRECCDQNRGTEQLCIITRDEPVID